MGTDTRKQYLSLQGKPILSYAIETFIGMPAVNNIILVVSPGDESFCLENIIPIHGRSKVQAVVAGGASRQESVYNGLLALPQGTNLVIIHDGVRPLFEGNEIDALLEAAAVNGAATLAVPPKDTVKLVNEDNKVVRTLPRERLWLTQTPQVFKYDIIINAHQKARRHGFEATDDASLVEVSGQQVRVIEGSYENIKITTPEDMIIAGAILNRRKHK
jgi:2-C-methyl-D-erythritol 4-phosphate cytidylyltransferase